MTNNFIKHNPDYSSRGYQILKISEIGPFTMSERIKIGFGSSKKVPTELFSFTMSDRIKIGLGSSKDFI